MARRNCARGIYDYTVMDSICLRSLNTFFVCLTFPTIRTLGPCCKIYLLHPNFRFVCIYVLRFLN
jgi:hypothetical protein